MDLSRTVNHQHSRSKSLCEEPEIRCAMSCIYCSNEWWQELRLFWTFWVDTGLCAMGFQSLRPHSRVIAIKLYSARLFAALQLLYTGKWWLNRLVLHSRYSIIRRVNPFNPTLFLIVAKWIYTKSVQRHTGLTHLFNFLTFGHSVAQDWAPECPDVNELKRVG